MSCQAVICQKCNSKILLGSAVVSELGQMGMEHVQPTCPKNVNTLEDNSFLENEVVPKWEPLVWTSEKMTQQVLVSHTG